MDRLNLTLFGGFQARLPAGSVPTLPVKAQALLAYLAVRPGQRHPRDKLAGLLWGDAGEAQARDSLKHTLAALRKAFDSVAGRVLSAEGKTFALDPELMDVDVVRFERGLAEATAETLEDAAALYQGDLLEGLAVNEAPFEEWLLAERERLRELAVEALAKLLTHQSQGGATERAIRTAARLLVLDPLQEVVHRALMRLFAQHGRRGAALKQYQICVSVLQRELGAAPEAETKQLYRELLQQRSFDAGRTRAPAAPTPTEPLGEIPLVGRDTELARLGAALEEAARGRRQVVVMVGEAGIGKTRLVEELGALAAQGSARAVVGRCYETEQILPFAPWVEAFRAAGVGVEALPADALPLAVRVTLGGLFPELTPGDAERPPASGNLLRLFEALSHLVTLLTARAPLVVVLEDLHWADDMSLRFLAFLGRRVPGVRLLVVATARDEETVPDSSLRRTLDELGPRPGFTSIPLRPLSSAETAHLVRALMKVGTEEGTLASLAAQVWRSSDGNPFVAVEMMRALELDASLVDLPLPGRVREVIAARLGRLGVHARHLIDVATVIGRAFDFALLQRAATVGEEEAAAACEELVRCRVLRGVGEHFEFVHDRVRDVAYRQLLAPRRKLLHRAVARAIESLYETDLVAQTAALAAHYREGDVPEKAVTYLALAGELAARRSAHVEVLATTELALAEVERLPASERDRPAVAIGFRREDSFFFLGRIGESMELLRRLRDPVDRLRDPVVTARYHASLGRTSLFAGDGETADRSSKLALEAASASGETAIMGEAHYIIAYRAYFALRPRVGLEHSRRALELLRGQGREYLEASALITMAFNHLLLGDLNLALEAAREVGRLGEATEDSRPQAWSAWLCASLLARMGDGEAAVVEGQRALELASDPLNRSMTLANLGRAHVARSAPAEALPLLTEALEIADTQTRVPQHRVAMRELLAEAYLLVGDLDRASALVHEALGIPQCEQWFGGGGLRGMRGRLAWARGDLAAAEEEFEAALGIFESIPSRFELGRTRLFMAEMARDRGAVEAATRHARVALDEFRALELSRWVDRAAEVLGRK